MPNRIDSDEYNFGIKIPKLRGGKPVYVWKLEAQDKVPELTERYIEQRRNVRLTTKAGYKTVINVKESDETKISNKIRLEI